MVLSSTACTRPSLSAGFERTVDQLVLLDERLALKRLRANRHVEMVHRSRPVETATSASGDLGANQAGERRVSRSRLQPRVARVEGIGESARLAKRFGQAASRFRLSAAVTPLAR